MWSNRTRPAAAAALAVGCLGFAAATTGAVAAPHHHAAASKKQATRTGFYVATSKSKQRVTSSRAPGAFVEDENGNQHVVTTAASATDGQGHIRYYTKKSGKHTTWKWHNVPGLRPLDTGIAIQAGLSDGGRRVWAVFYQCDGVYVADASTTATRLPEPTLVQSVDSCGSQPMPSNNPPITQAFGSQYGRSVGILLPDPAQGGTPAVWSGTPGGTFTPGPALPTSDGFTPVQLTFNEDTNTIVVVGYGSDGTSQGVYVTRSRFSEPWSAPRRVASLASATDDYVIEAIVANGPTYIGLERIGGNQGLFLVHGTKSGQWGGAIRLKHTASMDTSLRLYINPDSGHLHAAFSRHGPNSQRGMYFERHGAHGWQKPVRFTKVAHDVAQQMVIGPNGNAVIGYLRK